MSSAPADYYDDSVSMTCVRTLTARLTSDLLQYDDGYLEPDGNSTIDCSLCLNELCLNADDYELYRSWVSVDTYEMVFISLITVVFLTGIIGNTLVIMAVSSTKSMQSVTNIFIVNLAVADILVMLFCAPPSIIWDVTNTWIFGSAMCRIVIFIQVPSALQRILALIPARTKWPALLHVAGPFSFRVCADADVHRLRPLSRHLQALAVLLAEVQGALGHRSHMVRCVSAAKSSNNVSWSHFTKGSHS